MSRKISKSGERERLEWSYWVKFISLKQLSGGGDSPPLSWNSKGSAARVAESARKLPPWLWSTKFGEDSGRGREKDLKVGVDVTMGASSGPISPSMAS